MWSIAGPSTSKTMHAYNYRKSQVLRTITCPWSWKRQLTVRLVIARIQTHIIVHGTTVVLWTLDPFLSLSPYHDFFLWFARGYELKSSEMLGEPAELFISWVHLFQLRTSKYNLRGTDLLTVPRPRTTTYGLNSLKHLALKIWNSLTDKNKNGQ